MADFLVIVGIVIFVAVMLGLIWGLERVRPSSNGCCSRWR